MGNSSVSVLVQLLHNSLGRLVTSSTSVKWGCDGKKVPSTQRDFGQTTSLTHFTFCPVAVPAIPTSNSYSKKTQSNNAENQRPEEETGRKASSTAKVPASPLPGLERKKATPPPSTVSHELPSPGPRLPLVLWSSLVQPGPWLYLSLL